MVIDEKTQKAQVGKVFRFSIEASLNVAHKLTTSENIVDCVIHRVVKKSSYVVLVGTHISWISVKALSHLKNSRRGAKLAPECFWYFRNRIDSDSVKAKSLN